MITDKVLDAKIRNAANHFGIVLDTIEVNDEVKGVNAYSIRDTLTVGYSGAVLELSLHEALVVMGHELAHLAMAHSHSTHAHEYEADAEAVEIMEYWGISPLRMIALWTKMGVEGSESHPGWKDRVDNIRRVIKERKQC